MRSENASFNLGTSGTEGHQDRALGQSQLRVDHQRVLIGCAGIITGSRNARTVVNRRATARNCKRRNRETEANTIRGDGELY